MQGVFLFPLKIPQKSSFFYLNENVKMICLQIWDKKKKIGKSYHQKEEGCTVFHDKSVFLVFPT
jgi:hypothetical protein